MDNQEVQKLLNQLQHEQQLVRSKGQTKLKTLLEQGESRESVLEALKGGVLDMLVSESQHSRLGGFLAATLILPHTQEETEFCNQVEKACVQNLEHPESRVRRAVGDCMQVLARCVGGVLYASIKDSIRDSIVRNFDRDDEAISSGGDDPLENLLETSYRVTKPGHGEMRHGTEGWKSLETSYRSLLKIIQGTGAAFRVFLNPDLWSLVFRGIEHPNRFVREICYFTIGAMVEISQEDETVRDEIVSVLAKGLGDDWSQVRYAASVATRMFMLRAKEAEFVADIFQIGRASCRERV